MPRKRTSRVKKQAVGPRQVNLRVKSGRVMWCRTKKTGWRIAKWALVLFVLVVAGVAGKAALQQVFLDNEEFALRKVELWQWDNEEMPQLVDHARLAEVTGLDPTASIFAFDLGTLQNELEALPEVNQVRATRRLPNVLRIRVEERVPIAWVDAPKQRLVGRDYHRGLLVDGDGYCFRPSATMFKVVNDLPVITTNGRSEGPYKSGQKVEGREFLRALELIKLSTRYLAEAGWSLPVVGLRNEFSLLAKTHTGTVVTFGLYEHERQMEDLLLILNHARNTSRGVNRVNLIPERNIPVVFAKAGGELAPPQSQLESNLQAILTRG